MVIEQSEKKYSTILTKKSLRCFLNDYLIKHIDINLIKEDDNSSLYLVYENQAQEQSLVNAANRASLFRKISGIYLFYFCLDTDSHILPSKYELDSDFAPVNL